jgi:hypothetical protein
MYEHTNATSSGRTSRLCGRRASLCCIGCTTFLYFYLANVSQLLVAACLQVPACFFVGNSDLHLLFISRPTISCLTSASLDESWPRCPPMLQFHVIKLFTIARSMRKQSSRRHHLSERLPTAYLSRLWSK